MKMKIMKYLLCVGTILLFLTLCASLNNTTVSAMCKTSVQAKKELKKVNTKIKKLKKQKSVIKNEYKALLKKENSEISGSIPIIFGSIIRNDPMVVKSGGNYYYVKNSSNAIVLYSTFSGHIKLNTGYTVIDRITCRNATAVKSKYTSKRSKSYKKLESIEDKLDELIMDKKSLVNSLNYKFNLKDDAMYQNEYIKLSFKKTYLNKIEWSSSNNNVATVNSKGKITGLNPGVATITAKASISNCTRTMVITVNALADLQLNYTQLFIAKGDSVKITSAILGDIDSYMPNNYIYNKSSNESCAVCPDDDNGIISGIGVGTCVISFYNEKYFSTIQVTVTDPILTYQKSQQEFTKDDVGKQFNITFTTNTRDVIIATETPDNIRIDSIVYPEIGNGVQTVTGTITYTILSEKVSNICLFSDSYYLSTLYDDADEYDEDDAQNYRKEPIRIPIMKY